VEHPVEEVANANRHGSKGTIEGPYYIPNAPSQNTPATLPMRDSEPGTSFSIRRTDTGPALLDGANPTALPGAASPKSGPVKV
jgi:catechol 1,2-dioxygenase